MSEHDNSLKSAEVGRSLAEEVFSQYPNTTKSLTWLKDNKLEFESRITDFDSVVAIMNEALVNPSSANEQYRVEIKQLVDFSIIHIPSLQEAEAETTNNSIRKSPVLQAYFQGKREFGWADEEYDPNRPAKSAIGIFLEGYGRYIGLRLSNKSEKTAKIQKAFVYAFEAVLLVEHPNSKLLGDIKEWMKDDADNFSKPIQELLN